MLSQAIQQVLFTRPLEKEVPDIVKKYGGSLYIPSPANCFQDSVGTTPCTVDSPVGYLKDLVGTNHATQGTAGFKPILRGNVKNLFRNSSFSGGVAGSPGTAPTSVPIANAPTGITRTLAYGITADGKAYIDVTYSGTNTSGATQYPSVRSDITTNPAISGQTFTLSAELALISGSWPTSANIQIGELNSSLGFLVGGTTSIKTTVTTSTLTKVSHTRTLINASTAYVSAYLVTFTINNNEAVNFTVRIVNPQLEIGSKASQYVPTPASAAASSSYGPYWLDFDGTDDRLQLGSVPFQMSSNQTVIVSGQPLAASKPMFALAAGSTSESLPYLGTNASSYLGYESSGGGTTVTAFDTVSSLGINSVLSAVKTTDAIYVYKNSKAMASGTTSGTYTTATNAMLGGSGRTTVVSYRGSINCAAILPQAASQTDMRKIEKYAAKLSGAQL